MSLWFQCVCSGGRALAKISETKARVAAASTVNVRSGTACRSEDVGWPKSFTCIVPCVFVLLAMVSWDEVRDVSQPGGEATDRLVWKVHSWLVSN